jgi:hypothetical protein
MTRKQQKEMYLFLVDDDISANKKMHRCDDFKLNISGLFRLLNLNHYCMAKGQLISEGNFGVIKSPKKWTFFFVRISAPHSRFGHYFCSNLYGRAPRGPRGVKKSEFFLQIKLLSFCARIAPKRHKLQKIVKIEQKCLKNLVFLEYFKYSSIWGQY